MAVGHDRRAGVRRCQHALDGVGIALRVGGGRASGVHGDLERVLVLGVRAQHAHGLPRRGGERGVGHLDVVIVLFLRRAHERNVHIAAGDGRVDADGMLGGVLELEVQRAPVDGGVLPHIDIRHGEHMRRALDHVQIGVQHGLIDRGRDLADAAAGLRLALAARLIDGGGAVALFGRALADDLVERENFARIQDRAVDGGAGKLQILCAVGVDNVRAVIFGERGGEILLFQAFQRDLRDKVLHLDGEGLPRVRHGDLLGIILQIEAEALDLRHELVLFLVVVRVRHLGAVFVVVRLEIDRLARDGVVVKGELGEIPGVIAREHGVIELVHVQRDLRRAGDDGDGLRRLVKGDRRLDERLLCLGSRLLQRAADILGVQVETGREVHVVAPGLRAAMGENGAERTAVAPVGHGGVHRFVGVERDVRRVGVDRHGLVGQGDGKRVGGKAAGDLVLHGGKRRLAVKPADVDARDVDIGINGAAAHEHEAVGAHGERRDKHERAENDGGLAAGAHPAALSAAAAALLARCRSARCAAGFEFTFFSDKDPLPDIAAGGRAARKKQNIVCTLYYRTSRRFLQCAIRLKCRPKILNFL